MKTKKQRLFFLAKTAFICATLIVNSTVNAQSLPAVYTHLLKFSKIADQYGNHRAADTNAYEASAQYIEQVLHKAGYAPQRQYFTYTARKNLKNTLHVVQPDVFNIINRPVIGAPATPVGGIVAELATPATPAACKASEWGNVDLTGKIVLLAISNRTDCPFDQQLREAKNRRALAAIFYIPKLEQVIDLSINDPSQAIPATHIGYTSVRTLLDQPAPVILNMDTDAINAPHTSFNIIADKRGRSGSVVMAGAHLDSVMESPGISDNASGSAAILAAAEALRQRTYEHTLRFVWWGAEEVGIYGSRHYVADLQKNDPDSLKRIRGYLNFDTLGSSNYVVAVYEAAAEQNISADSLERALTDYFQSVQQPWIKVRSALSGSDAAPFMRAGVPVGGMISLGDHRYKTPEEKQMFGGQSGVPYDPYMHTSADNINDLAWKAIDIFTPAIEAALNRLGNAH